LRFVLLLPLIAMPQVTGRPAVLLLVVTGTVAGTLLAAIARYRRRDQIAASGSSPMATGDTTLGQSMRLSALEANHTAGGTARRMGDSTSPVEAMRAPSIEKGVSR
jgi:hypothetical protein